MPGYADMNRQRAIQAGIRIIRSGDRPLYHVRRIPGTNGTAGHVVELDDLRVDATTPTGLLGAARVRIARELEVPTAAFDVIYLVVDHD